MTEKKNPPPEGPTRPQEPRPAADPPHAPAGPPGPLREREEGPEPGIPQAVDPEQDIPTRPIHLGVPVLDEESFMRECASRLNSFIATYPDEAHHVLNTRIEYAHELVGVYQALPGRNPSKPPSVTVAALLAALLQTHQGTGFVLQPLLGPGSRVLRFVVRRQEPPEDQEPPA